MLYGVSPLDRATWVATTVTLVTIGLLATLVPAVRATRADPLLAIVRLTAELGSDSERHRSNAFPRSCVQGVDSMGSEP